MDLYSTLGNRVATDISTTQTELRTDTQRLSSGLRINSAADDPSGLAISKGLAVLAAGLDQGVSQAQEASNLVQTADGALQAITAMLQRMRSLVVEATSTINSTSDVSNLQAEITQLLLEINKVSQTTTFNGKNLLDGSLSSDAVNSNQQLIFGSNSTLASGQQLIPTDLATINPTTSPPGSGLYTGSFVQTVQITSYDPASDTYYATFEIESNDPTFGPPQVQTDVPLAGNADPYANPLGPNSNLQQFTNNGTGATVINFSIGNLTSPNDVGATSFMFTIPGQNKAQGQNLNVNLGSAEGDNVFVDVPAVNTNNLGVSGLQVGSDPTLNEAALYQVDYGLNYVTGIQARLGAQVVSINAAITDNQTQAVNATASSSNIADLNIGQASTAYDRALTESVVQTSVLAETEAMQKSILTLFNTTALP